MAEIQLAGTSLASESGGTITINNGTLGSSVVFPTDHIIQIVQTVKTDRFIGAGNTNEQVITGYNCEITPHKTGSKILIYYSFGTSAQITVTARSYIERDVAGNGYSKLTGMMGDDPGGSLGDPSLSHAGTTQNWFLNNHAGMYVDNPTYSSGNAITYRIGVQSESASYPVYVGSTQRDNSQYHPRTASVLILMEVAQ
jgi:hypothetical protein